MPREGTPQAIKQAIEQVQEWATREHVKIFLRPGYAERIYLYAYYSIGEKKVAKVEKDLGLCRNTLRAILSKGMPLNNTKDFKYPRCYRLFYRFYRRFMNNYVKRIDRSIYKGIKEDYKFAHDVKKAIDPEYGKQKIQVDKTINQTIKFINCSNDELDKLIHENLKALPEKERESVIEMMKSKEGVYEPQTGNTPNS